MTVTSFMVKVLFTLRNVRLDFRGVLIYLPSYEERLWTMISIFGLCVCGAHRFKIMKKIDIYGSKV
jgi:hypothetical protein